MLIAAMLGTASFAENTITSFWFEFQLDGKGFGCASLIEGTLIEGKDHKMQNFGPILVFPIALKDQCSVGQHGGWTLVTRSGTVTSPPPDDSWFIKFRDIRIPSEPGRLYYVARAADGSDFILRSIPFPANPSEPIHSLKERVLTALQ